MTEQTEVMDALVAAREELGSAQRLLINYARELSQMEDIIDEFVEEDSAMTWELFIKELDKAAEQFTQIWIRHGIYLENAAEVIINSAPGTPLEQCEKVLGNLRSLTWGKLRRVVDFYSGFDDAIASSK